MKKQVILLLTCCLLGLLNIAKSQSAIGLSVSATTVESGALISFTATNESASKSITEWGIMQYQFTNESLRPNLSYSFPTYNYYNAANNTPGKWNYRFVNSGTQPIEVTIFFRVALMTFVNGLAHSKEYTTLQAKITVNPPPPPVVTRYYHLGTQVTYSEYNNIYNLDRHGSYTPGVSTIGPNLLQEKYYTPAEAAIRFGITDGGAAYELTYKPLGEGPIILGG